MSKERRYSLQKGDDNQSYLYENGQLQGLLRNAPITPELIADLFSREASEALDELDGYTTEDHTHTTTRLTQESVLLTLQAALSDIYKDHSDSNYAIKAHLLLDIVQNLNTLSPTEKEIFSQISQCDAIERKFNETLISVTESSKPTAMKTTEPKSSQQQDFEFGNALEDYRHNLKSLCQTALSGTDRQYNKAKISADIALVKLVTAASNDHYRQIASQKLKQVYTHGYGLHDQEITVGSTLEKRTSELTGMFQVHSDLIQYGTEHYEFIQSEKQLSTEALSAAEQILHLSNEICAQGEVNDIVLAKMSEQLLHYTESMTLDDLNTSFNILLQSHIDAATNTAWKERLLKLKERIIDPVTLTTDTRSTTDISTDATSHSRNTAFPNINDAETSTSMRTSLDRNRADQQTVTSFDNQKDGSVHSNNPSSQLLQERISKSLIQFYDKYQSEVTNKPPQLTEPVDPITVYPQFRDTLKQIMQGIENNVDGATYSELKGQAQASFGAILDAVPSAQDREILSKRLAAINKHRFGISKPAEGNTIQEQRIKDINALFADFQGRLKHSKSTSETMEIEAHTSKLALEACEELLTIMDTQQNPDQHERDYVLDALENLAQNLNDYDRRNALPKLIDQHIASTGESWIPQAVIWKKQLEELQDSLLSSEIGNTDEKGKINYADQLGQQTSTDRGSRSR